MNNEERNIRQEQLLDAWRAMLKDQNGRIVLSFLLISAGLFRCSLSEKTENTMVLEGQRQIALLIHSSCLRADKAAYHRLMAEILGGYNG